jgi:hypothetical protein
VISRHLLCWLGLAVLLASPARGEDVQVTVLAILASDKSDKVDPKLKDIAERVQKQEPKLTEFRLGQTSSTNVAVGSEEMFQLVEDQVAKVTVQAGAKKEKIRLTVKAPKLGQLTYTTCCDKYFPIVTGYKTQNKERLILAIMVERCKNK